MDNIGKKFEDEFKKDWVKCFPGTFIYRLHDLTTGYKVVSQQISDYLAYSYPFFFIIELKTHKGASIPFDAIPQIDRLKQYIGVKGIRVGVILFLYEQKENQLLYIPASTLVKLIEDGEKSVGIRHLGKYNIKVIPGKMKRVFFDGDYRVLMDLEDGE